MKRVLVLMAVYLLGGHCLAGELTFVKPEMASPMQQFPLHRLLYFQDKEFRINTEGQGTVHPQAVVAVSESQNTLAIAIDAKTVEAKNPEVIRLDFTGRGNFHDAVEVSFSEVTAVGDFFRGTFEPAVWEIKHQGETIPLLIHGQYGKYSGGRYAAVSFFSCKRGDCLFGNETYPVVLYDESCDLSYHQPSKPKNKSGFSFERGDLYEIKVAERIIRGFYGQPVFLDGRWWNVMVDEKDQQVTAEPIDLPTAWIRVTNLDECSLMEMAYEDGGYMLWNPPTPTPIPAGSYRLSVYTGKIRYNNTFPTLFAQGEEGVLQTFPAGETTDLPLGLPMKGRINVLQKKNRVVSLNYSCLGPQGLSVSLHIPNSTPPTLRVFDNDGKEIYSAAMEFG